MKYLIPITALVLTIACQQQSAPATQGITIAQDSTASTLTIPTKIAYTTEASAECGGYLLSFKSSFQFPEGALKEDSNSYFDRNWLFLENKITHKTDSLELTDVPDRTPFHIVIEDVTEKYLFTSPLAELTYMVENDAVHHTFLSCANDSLQMLFITDGPIISMQRQARTINGIILACIDFIPCRKYPFIASLNDHQLNVIKRDTEILGYEGRARMDINAFRLNGNKSMPFLIKESTPFRLDTLYRSADLIRMTISDSIPIYGRPGNVLGHLVGDDAG